MEEAKRSLSMHSSRLAYVANAQSDLEPAHPFEPFGYTPDHVMLGTEWLRAAHVVQWWFECAEITFDSRTRLINPLSGLWSWKEGPEAPNYEKCLLIEEGGGNHTTSKLVCTV